ncbi:MAG: hypothetical protein KTR33_06250 [Gammaproteobacteria bacterium]|nr:hypothetical protein [Gammaproteobacteria bacterium]
MFDRDGLSDPEVRVFQDTADAIESMLPALESAGVSVDDLDALQRSASQLRFDADGVNAARIESEFRRALEQLEQLELALSGNAGTFDVKSGRDTGSSVGDYSDEVSDYFRNLSEDPAN